MQTFIKPDGTAVLVKDEDVQKAVDKGLTYARRMRRPDGKEVLVKSHDLNKAKKGGFRDAELDDFELSRAKADGGGAGEAALRGFGNTGSMGFVDEVAGAMKNPLGALKSAANILPGVNIQDQDTAAYKQGRDVYRAEDDAAYDKNQGAYIAGGAVGGLSNAALPLGGAAKAAQGAVKGVGLASGVGRALVGRGAMEGAAMGLGGGVNTQAADLTQDQQGGALLEAGLGGTLGAAIPAAGGALAKKAVGAWAGRKANEQALKGAGLYRVQDVKKYADKAFGGDLQKAVDHMGARIREDGLVKLGRRAGGQEIVDSLEAQNKRFMGEQRELIGSLKGDIDVGAVGQKLAREAEDQHGFLNPQRQEFLEEAAENLAEREGMAPHAASGMAPSERVGLPREGKPPPEFLTASDSSRSYLQGAMDQSETLGKLGAVSPKDALRMAQLASQDAKYGMDASQAGKAKMFGRTNELLRGAIDDAADRELGAGSGAAYKAARQKERDTLELTKWAKQRYARDLANNAVGITSYGAGSIGAHIAPDPASKALLGGTFMALNELKRRYGNSTMMTIYSMLEKDGVRAGIKRIADTYGPRMAAEISGALEDMVKSPKQAGAN